MRQLLFLPLLCLLCLPPPATDGTFPPAVANAQRPGEIIIMCEPPPGSVGAKEQERLDQEWLRKRRMADPNVVYRVSADESKKDDKKSPAPALTPTIKLPAAVSGDPGSFITIAAETNGVTVSWKVVDPGLNLFPTALLKDTKTAVVTGSTPGKYRVWAFTALGDVPSEVAECVVTVNGTPVPPVPPVPPGPVSDLTKAFQNAYALDTEASRAASLGFLTSAYKGMAAQATAQTFTTNAQCVQWMKSVVEAPGVGLTSAQIVNLRKAIAAELGRAWGSTTAPLAPADAAKELDTIYNALAGVK